MRTSLKIYISERCEMFEDPRSLMNSIEIWIIDWNKNDELDSKNLNWRVSFIRQQTTPKVKGLLLTSDICFDVVVYDDEGNIVCEWRDQLIDPLASPCNLSKFGDERWPSDQVLDRDDVFHQLEILHEHFLWIVNEKNKDGTVDEFKVTSLWFLNS